MPIDFCGVRSASLLFLTFLVIELLELNVIFHWLLILALEDELFVICTDKDF